MGAGLSQPASDTMRPEDVKWGLGRRERHLAVYQVGAGAVPEHASLTSTLEEIHP